MAGSLYRRRRIIWTLLVLSVISLFYLATRTENSLSFGSWSLPAYLKDIGRPQAQEIHGLLHFVTAYPDRELNEQGETIEVDGLGPVKVEPQEAVDMKVYAPDGDRDWSTHMENLKEQHPLVVFSKSYCPYSQRAKALLHSYGLKPAPTVVEIDQRSDGPIIQAILYRLTGRKTVPNIILQGKSIGGSDDIVLLDQEEKLKPLLRDAGLTIGGL